MHSEKNNREIVRMKSQRVVLKERPRFQVPTEKCFRVEEADINAPGKGEILIQTVWLGMDPYLFSRVKKAQSVVQYETPCVTAEGSPALPTTLTTCRKRRYLNQA